MLQTMREPLRVENMVLLLIGLIYVEASRREVPIQELKITADTGRIKELPLQEREAEGIFYTHTYIHTVRIIQILTIY